MCSPVQDFKGAENPSGEKKPRCRVQVAWPLIQPGVDRPAAVSVSSFFSFMLSVPLFLHSIFFICFSLFLCFALLTVSVSQYIFIHNRSLSPVLHFTLQGERCSFSVQMWFYFLCGLRSDLWAILPADLAKEVLGQVLSETLQLLLQRYTSVRPSYRRHLQVRYCHTCTSV